MTAATATPKLDPALARDLHQTVASRHGWRGAAFVAFYLIGAWGSWRLAASAGAHPVIWLAVAPLWLLAAAALHGISLFTHEAVHGALARNPALNAFLGALCAWPVLQNFSAYKVLHLPHHRDLGGHDDPDHYSNYTRWTWLVFTMNWLRLLVGYPVYIVAIPILGWRRGMARERAGILAEVAALVLLAMVIWMSPLPRALLLHGWLLPMCIINFMVNVRGMSQHTLLPESTDAVRGTRSILTGRVVAFFMCNENYHLEHHLYPGVPWYHLPRVHAALRGELAAQGAPYIGSYSAFVREFVVGSVRRSPFGSKSAPKS